MVQLQIAHKWLQIAPNCAKWLSKGQIGFNLVHDAPNGSKGHQICQFFPQMGSNRLEQVQMDPNLSKLFHKGLIGSRWKNLVVIGPNGFKYVHIGPNWSKWVNIGPKRFKLIQICLVRSNKIQYYMLYDLSQSKF